MVQKEKGRRTWSISFTLGSLSFTSFIPPPLYFLMLVLTLGGLGMNLVLVPLLVGLFTTPLSLQLVAFTMILSGLLKFLRFKLYALLCLVSDCSMFSLFLTDMRPREIRLVMSGYLPSVMSQSDLVGFGILQNFQSLQSICLKYTISRLVEIVTCYSMCLQTRRVSFHPRISKFFKSSLNSEDPYSPTILL